LGRAGQGKSKQQSLGGGMLLLLLYMKSVVKIESARLVCAVPVFVFFRTF
jgi:hypothetical protein